MAQKRALASTVTRRASAEGAFIHFFKSFIKLLNSYGPGGRFVVATGASGIVASVGLS